MKQTKRYAYGADRQSGITQCLRWGTISLACYMRRRRTPIFGFVIKRGSSFGGIRGLICGRGALAPLFCKNHSDWLFLHECCGRQNAHIGLLCSAFVALHRTKIVQSSLIFFVCVVVVLRLLTRNSCWCFAVNSQSSIKTKVFRFNLASQAFHRSASA